MPNTKPDAISAAEHRERDRSRKTAARRRAGVVAQADRTLTRDLNALAALAGCSLRTIWNHRRSGTLAGFLTERDLADLCPPSLLTPANPFARSVRQRVVRPVEPEPAPTFSQNMTALRACADAAVAEFNAIDPAFGRRSHLRLVWSR